MVNLATRKLTNSLEDLELAMADCVHETSGMPVEIYFDTDLIGVEKETITETHHHAQSPPINLEMIIKDKTYSIQGVRIVIQYDMKTKVYYVHFIGGDYPFSRQHPHKIVSELLKFRVLT